MKWLLICVLALTVSTQQQPPIPKGFSWVSPGSPKLVSSISKKIRHRTFKSSSMGIDVGYYIYLPPGYYQPENKQRRYPVVYNLHGGRPGGEYKMISIHRFVDAAIRTSKIEPVIYVFPNGGPMS
jgi:enterochelin esterase-like enzyme